MRHFQHRILLVHEIYHVSGYVRIQQLAGNAQVSEPVHVRKLMHFGRIELELGIRRLLLYEEIRLEIIPDPGIPVLRRWKRRGHFR